MIVACVRSGTKYGVHYVDRLRAMVAHHLPVPHHFVCLTDRPMDLVNVCTTVNIEPLGLPKWWGKLYLFAETWRIGQRVLFFDLDTVIVDDLSPLAALDVDFGICENFTRLAGNTSWPCRYGSCVMTIGPGVGAHVWSVFNQDRDALMAEAQRYGDQKVIEALMPDATLLQRVLPPGYFVGYRDLTIDQASGCAVVVFAGRHKPDNCEIGWVRTAWER